jgi:two-component system, OmpR family, response regulator
MTKRAPDRASGARFVPTLDEMHAGRRTVLMVEDEESITKPLSDALEREGFATEIAGTVATALEAAERITPDLVLLDVMLPDGSGFEVCRALRERSSRSSC